MAHLLKEGLLFQTATKSKGLTYIMGHDSTGTCHCESIRGCKRVYLSLDKTEQQTFFQNLNLTSCVFLIAEHVSGTIASPCPSYLPLKLKGTQSPASPLGYRVVIPEEKSSTLTVDNAHIPESYSTVKIRRL